ncbi:MAG: hypothetical protein J2P21_23080, partial [Chloracidobacterium sp.]|nr:hypothetical protein [Chloracidobacterium sp.]
APTGVSQFMSGQPLELGFCIPNSSTGQRVSCFWTESPLISWFCREDGDIKTGAYLKDQYLSPSLAFLCFLYVLRE